MRNSRNQNHIAERLKDLQAYRQTLINRQNEVGTKIKKIEEQISELRKAAA